MKLNFIKMNGAGNDFVIFDARKQEISLSPEQIHLLSARDNEVTKGCDQLLILRKSNKADIFMQIYNADSGEVDACGNATRCIADMLEKELGRLPVSIQTNAAVLQGVRKINDYMAVDLGAAKFGWLDIPLAMPIEEAEKKIIDFINMPGLGTPTFVSMGNPHVVFFIDELPSDNEVKIIGSKIENYIDVFPNRVNVGFATIKQPHLIHAKIWERGAGLTQACGTGACAILSAYNKYEPNINDCSIHFANSGQGVYVHLENSGHILLAGSIEKEFEGAVEI